MPFDIIIYGFISHKDNYRTDKACETKNKAQNLVAICLFFCPMDGVGTSLPPNLEPYLTTLNYILQSK